MMYSLYGFVLLYIGRYVTMSVYLWRYEGGQCDRHERTVTYRRGGSTENPQETIYRQRVLEKRDYSRYQAGRWNVASEAIRPGCLPGEAEVQTRGQVKLVSDRALVAKEFSGHYATSCVALSLCSFWHRLLKCARGR